MLLLCISFQVSPNINIFQEFVYVLARIANVKIDPEELMRRANNSGLVRYLFGDDLKGKDDTTSPISSPSQNNV